MPDINKKKKSLSDAVMEAAKRAANRERAAGRAEAYAQSGRTMLDRAMMDRAIERATGQKPQRGMTPGPKAQQLELMVSQREEQKKQEAARMAMERMLRDEPNHSGTVGGNHGAVGGGSFELPEDRSRGLYGSDSIFDPLRTPTKAHDFYAGLDLEKAGRQLDALKGGRNKDAVARQEAAVRKAADIQADNAQALMYGNYDAGKAKQERDALRAAADQAQSSVDEYILGEYMDKREKLDAGYLYGSPEYLAAEEQLKAERAEKEAGAAGAQQKVRQLDDQIFEAEQYATQAGYEAAMRTDPQFDRYAAIGAGMGGVAENTPKKGSWQLDLDAIEQANKREKFMTDTQRAVFQYTLGKHGWDEAEKYLKSLDREINRKAAADTFAAIDQWVDSGVPGTIAANLYTVGASLGEGQAYLINAMDSAMGNRIDPYAAHNMVGRVNEEIRGKTAQNIQNGVGGFMGDAAAFLYQTGMSVADFSLVALTLGGGPTSLALMGARSAQSATMDAMDRGASDAQALTAGFWAGAAEVIFEKVSLDNFIKLSEGGGTGTFIANVFRQMGIEASEEFATEIANQISDYLVMGGLSNYQLAVKAYVQQGKSQEEAAKLARWDAAKQVGLAAVGGAVSGGFTGAQGQAIAAFNRHSNEKYIRPAGAPAQQPQNANDPIMQAAQIAAEREMQEEMHASAKVFPSAPSSLEQNAQAFQDAPAQPVQNTNDLIMQAAQKAWEKENPQARAEVVPTAPRAEGQVAVAVNEDGEALGPVTVTGVNSVENGHVYFDVQNADGTTGVMSDMDVDFADPETTELLASGVAGKLDARGVDAMLNGYNPDMADAGQYAREFAGIYSRAKAGMDYRQAADGSLAAQAYLTPEARQAAWTAGNAARNATTATQTAKTAKFQKAVLDGLNRVTGGKIRLTDADIGANGYYNPETREIVISSKADKGAYVYVAVHEMAHKLKAENVEAWSGFQTLVEDALLANGVDVDAAMAHAKELSRKQGRGELSTEAALEEVICNSAASILQDEAVLRDLVSKDRTTMQRVADFLREFLDNLTQAIQNLGRSMSELESWKQMQALKNDHESLRKIYESLTAALEEGNGQEQAQQDVHVVKYSAKESNYNPETASIKEQLENSREKLNSMQVVVSVNVPENMTNKREAADWAVDVLKSTGYRVDRQGFGKISFNANDINYAMNYADTPAEKAAIAALPKVLKRGIQIGNHSNHKGREKATITFAAPVELNGIRGNMAATVVLRGNHYYTHRIVLPDGSAFEFGTQKKEAVREPHRGVTVSSSLADATSTASKDIVRQNTGNVNAETGVQEDAGAKFSLKEDQINTPEFKRWFGKSKMVNEDGSPKVMYHGTLAKGIEEFRKDYIGSRYAADDVGFFFTDSESLANDYATSEFDSNRRGEVIPAYLSIQKPLVFDEKYAQKNGYGKIFRDNDAVDAWDNYQGTILEEAEEMGADGIMLSDGTSVMAIVFEPTQIKSATENVGTFDPENSKIRYSLRETDENVQSELSTLGEALTLTRGHRITAAEADRLAGTILQKTNSTYDRETLAKEIARIYDYAERADAPSMEQIDDEQTALMARVMEKMCIRDRL